MAYQVLARRWRPTTFTSVVGQEHVLKALTNALQQNRLHHAYLFSGTRGVGKTTIARILAKCLNCETGITPTPCCQCDACREIDAGQFLDLYEIDAASRTKVEDTRELLDNVKYLPNKGRYKIYLIDEVHMLSGHSFNALLKTLEEPPPHVIFLLATTDPQRLPITVLSRCLQFNLKALKIELIAKQLSTILDSEKIAYETAALQQLAIAAKGSIRDSLSLLDQAISFSNANLTAAEIRSMLGTVDEIYTYQLVETLAQQQPHEMINIIAKLTELAADFEKVLDDILTVIHKIGLYKTIPNLETTDWDYPEKIAALAPNFTPEELQLYYQIGLIGKRDLALAPTPRVGFEMVMLRLLAFAPENINPQLMAVPAVTVPPFSVPASSTTLDTTPTAAVNNATSATTTINTGFSLSQLSLTGPTSALIHHCVIANLGQNLAELLLDPSQSPLLNKKHEERLAAALSEHFQRPIEVKITIGTSNMDTPANIAKREQEKKHAAALQSLKQDQKFNELIKTFDAKIITDSIT